MKNVRLAVVALALAVVAYNPAAASDGKPGKKEAAKAAAELKVDPAKSELNWSGKKVTGEHNGTVKLSKGSLKVEGNKLVGGEFEADMKSIVNKDLTDADYNAKLVGHLKSDDFFGVEKFPTAKFKITKVEPIANAKAGEANYTVTGDLTIKGVTNPVTFPATVKIAGNKAEATAKFEVDRTKYDIRYGSKSFFDNIGDKAIHDNFTVDLKLVAGK